MKNWKTANQKSQYDENSQLGENQNISGKEAQAADREELGQLEHELKVNMESRRGNLADGKDYAAIEADEEFGNGLATGEEMEITEQEVDDLDVKNLDGTASPYENLSSDDDR